MFGGYGAPLHQLLGALQILLSEVPLSFRPLEFRVGAFRLGFVRPGVDDEQEIARFDCLAILEMDRIKVTANPCAHFHGLYRFQAAGEVIPFGDFLGNWSRDGNLRRRRSRWLGLAAEKQGCNRHHQAGIAAEKPASVTQVHRFWLMMNETAGQSPPRFMRAGDLTR